MTPFTQQVYNITSQIPKGKVVTYKQIAQQLNSQAYRAVGQALHNNPYAPQVPCHRVVASSGHLHGFASGLKQKQQMLENEGVQIKNKKVDLEKYGYAFSKKVKE